MIYNRTQQAHTDRMEVNGMDSMRALLKSASAGEDFYLLLGDFLDEFYRSDQAVRGKMITERPDDPSGCRREILGFAAATAHKLAIDYGLETPRWVFEKRCYLYGEPFFACGAKGNLRLLFLYKSPAEFKHRNLFVDENVLTRV